MAKSLRTLVAVALLACRVAHGFSAPGPLSRQPPARRLGRRLG
eukprot:CAMPEP_0172628050 /NCGR_PEP_ID=MMETSP1068-20121228/159569_1 /TAXON_ID=35684 /ORGANISM="Pseudopedinella elastica, Strain CCMP716" /LENGTH=42 /DNA_ID= /DNA_START= /DNA_END= /DNA_ORIENTATION=